MAKRIEKLDNERWKGWDWAASNKLNEVIEAVNTLTERVSEHIDHEARHVSEPTQVEPDKGYHEITTTDNIDKLIEPDTEQLDTRYMKGGNYKGKNVGDMSRQELIDALYHMSGLYRKQLENDGPRFTGQGELEQVDPRNSTTWESNTEKEK